MFRFLFNSWNVSNTCSRVLACIKTAATSSILAYTTPNFSVYFGKCIHLAAVLWDLSSRNENLTSGFYWNFATLPYIFLMNSHSKPFKNEPIKHVSGSEIFQCSGRLVFFFLLYQNLNKQSCSNMLKTLPWKKINWNQQAHTHKLSVLAWLWERNSSCF